MAEREIRVNIGGDTSGLDNALSKGQRNLRRFAAAGVAAIGATAVAMVGLTKASLANIDTLAKNARSLGLTTSALQRMTLVAGEAGVEAGQLSSMLGLMQRNIIELGDGTAAQVDAFARLGLSMKDLQGLSPDEQFRRIAESLNQIEDPAVKTATAMDIFGRSGRGAINMLDGYSAKVEEAAELQDRLNITVSELDAQQVEKANDAIGRVAMAFTGLGNVLAVKVAPLMIAFSDGVLNAIENADVLITGLKGLGVVLTGLVATQIPALIAGFVALTGGMSVATIATGAFTAAVNLARFATIALGGPIGVVAGLIGAAGAAWIVFGRDTSAAAVAMDEAEKAQDDLNDALDAFSKSATPANQAAVDRAAFMLDQAKATMAAAAAEEYRQGVLERTGQTAESVLVSQQGLMDYLDDSMGINRDAEKTISNLEEINNLLDRIGGNRVEPRTVGPYDTDPFGQTTGTGGRGAGPGGPMSAADRFIASTGGEFVPGADGGVGGGGAGAISNAMAARLVALQDGLMTERETIAAWYEEGRATLDDALAQELLTREGYADAVERLEAEHQKRLSAIKGSAQDQQLSEAAGFFGSLASVTRTGGEKTLKATQILAGAQGLINSYLAYTQALANPTLGIFGKFAAAASLLASGMKMVSAIKGVNASGGGGGVSGGGGAAPAAPQQQEATTFAFTIQNDPMGFGESFAVR